MAWPTTTEGWSKESTQQAKKKAVEERVRSGCHVDESGNAGYGVS